jgi:hypothetical protein
MRGKLGRRERNVADIRIKIWLGASAGPTTVSPEAARVILKIASAIPRRLQAYSIVRCETLGPVSVSQDCGYTANDCSDYSSLQDMT